MLYIGSNHNGTGHYLFKSKTKERMLVPKVTPVYMPKSIIKVLNEIETKEGETEGIQFGNLYDDVTTNSVEV